jgi:2-succinyl-5-enolpyruvyl-6-hydroxy-3-cyclohexene-1-carboxylate synthase
MSSELAVHVLQQIRESGVKTICVCPGARNAEWVEQLAKNDFGFEVFWFYEERSAAFFALGRIKLNGSPAAVVTTSGTAAGELLPATMEAYYSDLPLFLLTADRPRRFRGSGAPQAAEQANLFGIYTPIAYDLEGDDLLATIDSNHKPVHINACFEDPNAPQSSPAGLFTGEKQDLGLETTSVAAWLDHAARPLIIVGALSERERPFVEAFLARLGAPVYLESLSGLRASEVLEPIKLRVGDKLLRRAIASGYNPDGVIRIGGIPTHRTWRDLEDSHLPVLSISALEFSGLGRQSTLVQGNLSQILETFAPADQVADVACQLLEEDRVIYDRLQELLEKEPKSEPALFQALSNTIPENALVFLGNSLPIREWDLATTWNSRGLDVHASRGLNGIDGQVSTFLGMCGTERSNWAILGDLTTLYDLSGPWPFGQLPNPRETEATLVVMNNSGGKIFDRMFSTREFQNSHSLSFGPWAAHWGLTYHLVTDPEQLQPVVKTRHAGLRVIEISPDPGATQRFWNAYQEVLA